MRSTIFLSVSVKHLVPVIVKALIPKQIEHQTIAIQSLVPNITKYKNKLFYELLFLYHYVGHLCEIRVVIFSFYPLRGQIQGEGLVMSVIIEYISFIYKIKATNHSYISLDLIALQKQNAASIL